MNENNSTPRIILTNEYLSLSWDQYIRIAIAFFGILVNVINIIIFLSPKLKDITYVYMLANSITNVLYLALSLSGVFFYYCSNCPSSQSYLSALLSIILTFYVLDCLKLLHTILQVIISIRIYLTLLNKKHKADSYKKILIISVVLSLVFFAQEPFSFKIDTGVNQKGDIVYFTNLSSFGDSTAGDCFFLIQFGIRILLAVFVLTAINILNVIEFRKRFKNGMFNTFLYLL